MIDIDTHLSNLSPIDSQGLRADVMRAFYKRNPRLWVRDRLKEHLWSKQNDLFESVRDHRRTASPSCHDAGKSFVASRIACWWLDVHKPGEAFVVTSAPTNPQVRAILWREINRAHSKGKLPGRTNQTEYFMMNEFGKEELVGYGRKPSDVDPTSFQGIHAKYVLVIFDEACGMPKLLWDAADSLIANEFSRILVIGNPDDPTGEFCECCKPGSGWNVVKISAYDTPNFTNESVPDEIRPLLISHIWVDEKKRKWGEDNPIYKSKVLGEFPEVATDGLIPPHWIRLAQQREMNPVGHNEIGVDVGAGANESIIAHRRGPVVRVLEHKQSPNTMVTLGHVQLKLKETQATVAKVDYIGVGQGTVDRAKEIASDVNESEERKSIAKKITGVKVGKPARDKEQYANLRAEGFWNLRTRFEENNIDIDPFDDDLAAQLADIKWKPVNGRIQIESKKDMASRGRSSPDRADAVMLAFLEEEEKQWTAVTWGKKRKA